MGERLPRKKCELQQSEVAKVPLAEDSDSEEEMSGFAEVIKMVSSMEAMNQLESLVESENGCAISSPVHTSLVPAGQVPGAPDCPESAAPEPESFDEEGMDYSLRDLQKFVKCLG